LQSLLILALCLLVPTAAWAQELRPSGEQAFRQVQSQIEALYFSYDAESKQTLLKATATMIEQHPGAWQPDYYAALVNIQLGNLVRVNDHKAAYRYYRNALHHIHAAHARFPNAENTLVLADVYGKLASLKTIKVLYYGSRSKSFLKQAFKLSPRSPKNHLIAGIEIMWTPVIFGGSKKRAREFLDKALVLEKTWQETDPLVVHWATRPEILAHLAQLEILCNTPDQARRYIDQALRLVPDYGFIYRDILPQLDRFTQ
jgi:tetratricopeptide (TPR) repeat protein